MHLLRILYLTLLIVSYSTLATASPDPQNPTAKVGMRRGPDHSYPARCFFPANFPLKIVGASGDKSWLNVIDFEGETGWVQRNKLVTTAQTIIVQANREAPDHLANIRSNPDKTGTIIAYVGYGVILEKVATAGNWVKIKHPNSGITGWIYSRLLWDPRQ